MPLALKRPARFAPRAPRKAVRLPAMLRLADGRELGILLLDLSHEGFMASADLSLAAGTPVTVGIIGVGHVGAQIRWTEAGKIGGQFDVRLPSELLDQF